VDPILRDEVEDNLKIDHPNVFNTFFRRIPQLREMTAAVLQSRKEAEPPLFQEDTCWMEWPEECREIAVLQLLHHHIDRFLQSAGDHGFPPSEHRRCITTPNKPIPGSISKRKPDISLAYNSDDKQGYDWSHIPVPSELKSNPCEDNYSSTWLDLVRYTQKIFSA
jgi:hypothetical protein